MHDIMCMNGLGVIAEMASTPNPGINILPAPLATVIFHYHKSDAYEPDTPLQLHRTRSKARSSAFARSSAQSPGASRHFFARS